MASYDERKLKELEDERKHIMGILQRNKKELSDARAGKKTISRAKELALVQNINDAEKKTLPMLTKRIMKLKSDLAKKK